jgi:hypothetical protein
MLVFDVPRQAVRRFILAWDCLRGTDDQCTDLLREAIVTVGLYSEPEVTKRSRWSFRWRLQPVVITKAPAVEDPVAVSADESLVAEATTDDADTRVPVGAGV